MVGKGIKENERRTSAEVFRKNQVPPRKRRERDLRA